MKRLASLITHHSSLITLFLTLLATPAFAVDTLDLVIQAGEDYSLDLLVVDGDGAAVDISGDSFAASAKSDYVSATPFAVFSTARGDTGRLTLRLSRAATAANVGKRGVWDLLRTTAAGLKNYLLRGAVKIQYTVTQ